MSSGCWIEPDEECADNCPHSVYGQWVPNPVACWKPASASKSMNNAQAKGGASPWGQSLSFLLGNPHLPRQSPSQAHHPKCLFLSLHCNRARPLVNLQASSPLSVFMKTKNFWSVISRKEKLNFNCPIQQSLLYIIQDAIQMWPPLILDPILPGSKTVLLPSPYISICTSIVICSYHYYANLFTYLGWFYSQNWAVISLPSHKPSAELLSTRPWDKCMNECTSRWRRTVGRRCCLSTPT